MIQTGIRHEPFLDACGGEASPGENPADDVEVGCTDRATRRPTGILAESAIYSMHTIVLKPEPD
jgi:hypothetical protein